MHNWPGGTQSSRLRDDGFSERDILVTNADHIAAWRKILNQVDPPEEVRIKVAWFPDDMTLTINGWSILMESTVERDSWLLTFPREVTRFVDAPTKVGARGEEVQAVPVATHTPVESTHEAIAIVRHGPRTGISITLICRPFAGVQRKTNEAAADVPLSRQTPAQLRTLAARLGLGVNDRNETKGSLIERIRGAQTGVATV